MPSSPFAGVAEKDVVDVTLADGRLLRGAYLPTAGMHFLHQTAPQHPPQSTAAGPLDPVEVLSVTVVRTRAEILAESRRRSRGDPYPGSAPRTADDFRYRLETLAAAALREPDRRRQHQLFRQFDDVADVIALARSKRAWILAAAKWSLLSNAPPMLRDLWGSDVASPSLMARPRVQDFDPDPKVRRRRLALPDDVIAEARSIPNMLRAIRAAGLTVRISLAGDPACDRADLAIDLPDPKHRFIARGARAAGVTDWRLSWGGTWSRAADRRRRRVIESPAYSLLEALIHRG